MRAARVFAGLLLLLAVLVGPAQAADTDLPADQGFPIQVKVGAAVQALDGFDENTGQFQGTVDVRLRWRDSRLAKPPSQGASPPEVFRDVAAESKLAAIWVPQVEIINQKGEPTYRARGLRIFPDGRVELTTRIGGDFATDFNVERFPFDTQNLRFELAIRNVTADQVALSYDQDDLDYSQPFDALSLANWDIRPMDLKAAPLPGWYNASHARVIAALQIARSPGLMVVSIFIPLIASLIIPILAIWLNRIDDGLFQIETFELVNLVIGGLFAVIALNFTLYSGFTALASGDNTVNQLFALNYVTLGISLMINVLFYRFNVFSTLFGRYVQAEIYYYLMWAIPVLAATAATASILYALA